MKKTFYLLVFLILVLLSFKFIQQKDMFVDTSLKNEGLKVVNKEKEIQNREIKILFVGDIMLSRGVEYLHPKYKNIGNYPFQNISDFLQKFDITVGNLETPITNRGPYMVPYSLIFNSSPKYVKVLKDVGFDILSLANNHAMDRGENGLVQTVNYLKEQNIETIGVGERCREGIIKVIDGVSVGFLAYSYTGSNSEGNVKHKMVCDWNNTENIKKDIENMKNKTDYILVFAHSGLEYKKFPEKENENKMKQIIDFGATAVINTHPHVVQKVEKYKDGIIAYSLGNFVFDDQEMPGTDRGLVLEIILKDRKVEYREHKTAIENFCCPKLVE
jgi:poly-gamma-glutamate synthesis protein (capsule biosynthesis protein)